MAFRIINVRHSFGSFVRSAKLFQVIATPCWLEISLHILICGNVTFVSQINKHWRRQSTAAAVEAKSVNLPPTIVSQLNNGLKVATENTGGLTATVGLWIDAGSRWETDATNGVAHFLEHMAFKVRKSLCTDVCIFKRIGLSLVNCSTLWFVFVVVFFFFF